MSVRYARQEALSGWDQERLSGATLGIAGSGIMAFLCAWMAAAMGFGRLVLLHGGAAQRLDQLFSGAVDPVGGWSWESFFGRVNPRVKVYACPLRLHSRLVGRLPDLDGLIVAGNDTEALMAGEEVARKSAFPVVGGVAAGPLGAWGPARVNRLTAPFCGSPESPLVGQIISGLLVEEIRKGLLPLFGEGGSAEEVGLLRLGPRKEQEKERSVALLARRHSIAMVGAGALGTWFGWALGLSGLAIRLNIYDDDRVDETNLNRQVLFYDAVDQPKAPTLAARLQAFFPRLALTGYGLRVEEDCEDSLASKSILAACPDSFSVRALLNGWAQRHRRALLSGGTSAFGGTCAVYEPGKTACLSCRFDIDRLAEREQQPESCGRVPEASVVTSNAITGALMVLALLEMLGGHVPMGVWEYDGSAQERRIDHRSPRPACGCHRRGMV